MPASAIDKHLGKRIASSREAADLTLESLAEMIDYQPEQVAAMEAGTERVPSLALARISRVVDRPLSWFFEDLPGQEVFDAGETAKRSV